jgi:heme A synthase
MSRRTALREAQKARRRNILVGLVLAAIVTGVVGLGMGIPLAKTLFVTIDLLLALYIYALVQIRKDAEARAVRYEWSSRAA